MTGTSTTRRTFLARIASAPALAASITAVAAVSAPAVAEAPAIDPDAELRQLWAQYCEAREAYNAADAVHAPRRAAHDRDLEPFWNLTGGTEDRYSAWGGHQGWLDALAAAQKKARRKHKVGGPWRTMNRFDERSRATIEAIRAIEARTPFGIGIKIAALPFELDAEDYVEALEAALPDLDKLCGGTFATAVQS